MDENSNFSYAALVGLKGNDRGQELCYGQNKVEVKLAQASNANGIFLSCSDKLSVLNS